VLGGVAFNNVGELQTVNRVEFFRPSDETWHVAAPLPLPLNHLNVAGVDNKLYLLGALSGGLNWTVENVASVYHPTNDSWTSIAPMPNGTARGSSAVGVYDQKIYLAGGMTFLDLADHGRQDSVTTVSAYNIDTDTWDTDFPPLPQPRQHVGGAVVDGTFYVLGGRENSIAEYHNTLYALDLSSPSSGWRTLAPMPTARGGLMCAAQRYEIFCFGGEGNPESPAGVFNETEVYDTRTDSWRQLPAMDVPRHAADAVSVEGELWVPGGGLLEGAGPTGWFDSYKPAGSIKV